MYSCTETQAVCRGCGKHLHGSPYFKGGHASVWIDEKYSHEAKVNYFGGWVCSRSCDYRASLELEESMPGHGGQRSLSPEVMARIEGKWGANNA